MHGLIASCFPPKYLSLHRNLDRPKATVQTSGMEPLIMNFHLFRQMHVAIHIIPDALSAEAGSPVTWESWKAIAARARRPSPRETNQGSLLTHGSSS